MLYIGLNFFSLSLSPPTPSFSRIFSAPVSLFEDFWCLHALEKRLEIWQGWCIPGGNQNRFGQVVSLWKAWLYTLGRALQWLAAEVPICRGSGHCTRCSPAAPTTSCSISRGTPCPCKSRSGVVTAGSPRVGWCSSLASLKALYKRQHHLYLSFPLAVGITCLSFPVAEQGTELRSTCAVPCL